MPKKSAKTNGVDKLAKYAGDREPIVEMTNIVKRFGTVSAIEGVDFNVYPGEVVALLGDNGAGKSTLIKILTGVHTPTEGGIKFEGQSVRIGSPRKARSLGIETVYQDLALVPLMSVARNFFLGRELVGFTPPKLDFSQWRVPPRLVRLFERMGLGKRVERLGLNERVERLGIGKRVERFRLNERVERFGSSVKPASDASVKYANISGNYIVRYSKLAGKYTTKAIDYTLKFLRVLDLDKMGVETQKALEDIGIEKFADTGSRSVKEHVGKLSGGERQSVAIGRAVHFSAKVLILDEPTSALSVGETNKVITYTESAKESGLGVVFISHNISHVYQVADRYTIIRHGRKVSDYIKGELTEQDIADIITGKRES